MKSPFTGKEMVLKTEKAVLQFRKEDFEIIYHSFVCEDTNEHFTDDKLDNLNITQVHNQYREKYGIPFPEQIINIRKKYAVTAAKMSNILGFGINTYRQYEAGEIPSVANGRLILSVEQPEEFIRQVQASKHILGQKDFDKLIQVAQKLQIEENANQLDKIFENRIFLKQQPDEYTGYKKPDYQKVYMLIAYFAQEMPLYKTKLNKLLFYADFEMYRNFGFSITGNSYRAISYGPVPTEYEMLYSKLQSDNLIEAFYELYKNGQYGEIYQPKQPLDLDVFNENELIVIKQIADKFKPLTSSQAVNLSHNELAWIENQENHDVISYQKYAFFLKGV